MQYRLGIDTWVTGVIVFTRAFVEVRKPIRGIEVVSAKYLPTWFERLPACRTADTLWTNKAKINVAVGTGSRP